MVLWPLVTGARRSEVLAAMLDDVSWVKRELAIHCQLNAQGNREPVKGDRKREVVLGSVSSNSSRRTGVRARPVAWSSRATMAGPTPSGAVTKSCTPPSR
jgi:hypothetical protein